MLDHLNVHFDYLEKHTGNMAFFISFSKILETYTAENFKNWKKLDNLLERRDMFTKFDLYQIISIAEPYYDKR